MGRGKSTNPTTQRACTRQGTWKTRFIDSLARMGNVSRACKAARVSRDAAYEHRKLDAGFAAKWDDALERAADWLEREAWRRAVKGVDKPVYQQGGKVGTVREYSDNLLVFLLKGNKPEKYRERTNVELTGKGGGPVETKNTFDLAKLTAEELRTMRELRIKAAASDGKPADN